MTHSQDCPVSRENRQDLRKIILSAYDEHGQRRTIEEALQRGGSGKYFCPDNGCRAELVPRKASYNIPLSGDAGDGFYDRRAHFAALPDEFVQGPRRERTSLRREAIDLIASHCANQQKRANTDPASRMGIIR